MYATVDSDEMVTLQLVQNTGKLVGSSVGQQGLIFSVLSLSFCVLEDRLPA